RLLKSLFSKNSVQLDSASQQEPGCSKDAVEIEAGRGANDDPLLAEYLQEIEELETIPLRKEPSAHLDVNMEFESFEVLLKRTKNLDKLYNALLSVKPTSVESERDFSAVGLYLMKLRSNLSENLY
ncbi:hypothetical protein SK128_008550, partial [Halocaridina rubra]